MSFREVRGLLALAALCIGACGSPPPSAVDEEMLLVDVEACAREEAVCVREGSAAGTPLLVPGNHAAVLWARPECGAEDCDPAAEHCCAWSLGDIAPFSAEACRPKSSTCTGTIKPPTPAKITLPIRAHSDDARLAWIAIGLAAGGPARSLRVKIGDDETIVQPAEGWARVEVSGRDRRIPAGAQLELTATDGVFGIAWVVGRWKR